MTQKNAYLKSPDLFFRLIFCILSLGLICFSFLSQALADDDAEVVDRIVAVVNDEIIVLQDVNKLMQSISQQLAASAYSDEEKQRILTEMRQAYIDQEVNRKLIVQAANELEWLTVSEEEIDASMQQYMQQNNYTEEQLREGLAEEGLTMEDLRTQMKESSLASSLENYEVTSKIVITKEDVTQYYNQNPDKYSGQTTYHLRNIFINAPASDSASEQAAVEAKLVKIFEELASGESFENLARKYSETAYANEGGELGNFKLEDLTPSFSSAIEPLSPGEATQPIKTSEGYQILFVQEIHKESDVPLESVYNEIANELYQQQKAERSEAWIEGLRENAHIKIIE